MLVLIQCILAALLLLVQQKSWTRYHILNHIECVAMFPHLQTILGVWRCSHTWNHIGYVVTALFLFTSRHSMGDVVTHSGLLYYLEHWSSQPQTWKTWHHGSNWNLKSWNHLTRKRHRTWNSKSTWTVKKWNHLDSMKSWNHVNNMNSWKQLKLKKKEQQ